MPQANDANVSEMLAGLPLDKVLLAAAVLTVLRMVMLGAGAGRRARADQGESWPRVTADILESVIFAGVLVFFLIKPFLVQAFYIPSPSMETTLLGHDSGQLMQSVADPGALYTDTAHDRLFVNKFVYRVGDPHRHDIAVFRAPKRADVIHPDPEQKREETLIKRVIGVPGDTIVVTDGKLLVNGQEQHEPYLHEPMDPNFGAAARYGPEGMFATPEKPMHLGPGQYFMMGDNRNHSNDSRFWGPVTRERFIGKAMVIFMPLTRIRVLH